MAKEFKTIPQLVELLERRGVVIDVDAEAAIRRESYYAIVNGYKGPFLDREAMQRSDEDVYLPGTRFSQLYDLFLYDRDLRNITFPYLGRAEAVIKNAVVYSFCSAHPGPRDYLDRRNYTDAGSMLFPSLFTGDRRAEHRRDLDTLINTLTGKTMLKRRTPAFVRHYVERYGTVPLWVLQNDLTFGNVEHFYQLQRRGIQNAACKQVVQVRGSGGRLEPLELLRCTTVLVSFRNICAHDERLYCAEAKGAHYADMLAKLGRILPAEEASGLPVELGELNRRYEGRISPGTYEDIASGMRVGTE